jgi:hypothetical protein
MLLNILNYLLVELVLLLVGLPAITTLTQEVTPILAVVVTPITLTLLPLVRGITLEAMVAGRGLLVILLAPQGEAILPTKMEVTGCGLTTIPTL